MSQTAGEKTEQSQAEIGVPHQDVGHVSQSIHVGEEICVGECDKVMICGGTTEQGNETLYHKSRITSYCFSVLVRFADNKLMLL